MDLHPFEANHLKQLYFQGGGLQTIQAQNTELSLEYIDQISQVYKRFAHVGFSAIHNGIVYGCGGVLRRWEGVGEAWTYISETAINNKRAMVWITRQIQAHLDGLLEDEYFHRIECNVASNHPTGIKWAERFGFTNEGLMASYGADKSDWFRFAKVKV